LVTDRVSVESPVSLGKNVLKGGFMCFFKNAHDLFEAEIGWRRGQAEFPAGHD